ncbi:CoA transferase [Mycobacterium arosiense ATCC BAA-1401 = DSM 45069]|uniref:CoA transferase n=1 Tax=Mycobacterium arosiense ATCC BAA-1401 = DSM 45069 TaxID=1265311 RepID=A0A1W9ZDR2_MYCAI|nr:CoA transferase [Mycobacterium arosiense]ORA12718.1 CoA transferase [Mycobacterium arosiense ATCC BAA-1401 = DSM 45069]
MTAAARTPEDTVSPLAGIRVIDLSTTLPGAICTQFLADGGADVLMLEAPGGSPVRGLRGWPALGRNKRSRVAHLKTEAGAAILDEALAGADVLVTTFSPAALARVGIDSQALSAAHPQLVIAHITGWGRSGPWRDLKGYEALVHAKAGLSHALRRMANPPQPAYITTPYASFAAGHIAVHGILAAIHERRRSGIGQIVDADLVRGVHAIDAWNWFGELVGIRWPDSYTTAEAWTPEGAPQSPLLLALLAGTTKDGHWLQFAQVSPRLFREMLTEFGVLPLLADPKWKGFPALEDPGLYKEFWSILLSKVAERTLAEWTQCFENNPNLCAELFRSGPQVFDHPQLVHDGRSIVVDDPEVGPVRQPTTLIHTRRGPLRCPRPAPRIDDAASDRPMLGRQTASEKGGLADAPPLAGVTILEFGEMFAAPYASSVLADLGARVIKFEAMNGDNIRTLLPFPEAAGAKVMQGKQSIQVDLHTDEGRAIAHRLVASADVVLQSMRSGAADRLGIGADTLRAINPDLIYVSAPGYGQDGPFGDRPAYAPSIAAAGGIALTNMPDAMRATADLDDTMHQVPRVTAAGAAPELQCDGLAALAVASTILTALVGRDRGRPLGAVRTSMLATVTHVLTDWVVDYPGAPEPVAPKHGVYGLSALYRIYEASEGRIFLAAPQPKEWPALAAALSAFTDLADDERFATPEGREARDSKLAEHLSEVFAKESAATWEKHLSAAGVGCVQVHDGAPARLLQVDPQLAAEYTARAFSPIFDEHLRLSPLVNMSRSSTLSPGGCLAGQHTDAVLREFGYDSEAIAKWQDTGVIHCG